MNNGVFTHRMPQRSMRLRERTKAPAAAANTRHAYRPKRSTSESETVNHRGIPKALNKDISVQSTTLMSTGA